MLYLIPSTGNKQPSAAAWSILSKQLHTATEHLFHLIQEPITIPQYPLRQLFQQIYILIGTSFPLQKLLWVPNEYKA